MVKKLLFPPRGQDERIEHPLFSKSYEGYKYEARKKPKIYSKPTTNKWREVSKFIRKKNNTEHSLHTSLHKHYRLNDHLHPAQPRQNQSAWMSWMQGME